MSSRPPRQTLFGLKVTRSDEKIKKKWREGRDKKDKRVEENKKKIDIPIHLYIVYFGAGCDFFNTVFINPD